MKNLLKQKDREICCLSKELTSKDELLGKYYSQIDELRRDMKSRSRKYQRVLNRLKDAAVQRLSKLPTEDLNLDCEEFNENAMETLFNAILKEMDCLRSKFSKRNDESDRQMQCVISENKSISSERNELNRRLVELRTENDHLREELTCVRSSRTENEDLSKRLEQVKGERDRLLEKVNSLHQNIQELDTSFKETRWALSAEVAEKTNQIVELRRCLNDWEEHVHRKGMTHCRENILREMRKEVKCHPKCTTVCTLENITKVPVQLPPEKQISNQPWIVEVPVKEHSDDDLTLDIHIFPIQETENARSTVKNARKYFSDNFSSVEVQTEIKRAASKTRNVSTQHTTRIQKLPRSFGTLTVTPWSGEGPAWDVEPHLPKKTRETMQGIYTVPCSGVS